MIIYLAPDLHARPVLEWAREITTDNIVVEPHPTLPLVAVAEEYAPLFEIAFGEFVRDWMPKDQQRGVNGILFR